MINKSITLLLFALFAACPNAHAMKHVSKLFGKSQSYRSLRAEYVETKKNNAETLTLASNLLNKEEANTFLVLRAKAAEEYNKGIQLMKSQPDTEKIKSIIKDDKERGKKSRKEFRKENPFLVYGTIPTIMGLEALRGYLLTSDVVVSALSGSLDGVVLGTAFGMIACKEKIVDLKFRRKQIENYKKEWLQEKITAIEQSANLQEKTTEKQS